MTHHPTLLNGRWASLTFAEQMGNVGSEVYRALMWDERKDAVRRDSALERALELFDATASDTRWSFARKKELLRVREGFLGYIRGENEQAWNPNTLNQYFDGFANIARAHV